MASSDAPSNKNSRSRYYATLEEYQLHKYTTSTSANAKIDTGSAIVKTRNDERRDRRMDYKSSKYEHVVNQREPKSPNVTGSLKPRSNSNIKPLAPPSSSNQTYDYVHPKRISPHRERSRREDDRNRYTQENSRRPSKSPAKRESNDASRPMKTMFRKSAIQDVIKTFQCNDGSKVVPTTVYSNGKGSNKNAPQPMEDSNALDNSLLEKDEQSAFHPFDSVSTARSNGRSNGRINDWLHSENNNGASKNPLQSLLKKPIQVCREQFTEEPTVEMKEGRPYYEMTERCGEKDKTFLKLKSTWGDDDLSDIFRRPSSSFEKRRVRDDKHDPFLGSRSISRSFSRNSDRSNLDEEERFKRAAMDSVKKVIQFPKDDVKKIKVSLKGGNKSPIRSVVLTPNPKDNVPSRRSPNRERQKERIRSNSRGGSSTSSNHRGFRTVKEILKDHKFTSGKNGNLLDDTLSDSEEEETPRLRNQRKSFSTKTPLSARTSQTERSTPSTTLTSHSEISHNPLQTPNPPRDVKLTLFEGGNNDASHPNVKHHPATDFVMQDQSVKKMDHDREAQQKKMEELKAEWKRSQLQIKRMLADEVVEWFRNEEEASVMMTEMIKMTKAKEASEAEVLAHKEAKESLSEENEALKKQLARYKARKFYKTGDEASSNVSSETGSSATTSTAINFASSEQLTMQAAIVDLKAKLSEQEKSYDELKKLHDERELSHKAQIHKLMRNRKDHKSSAEFTVMETQLVTLQKNVELHKEQLKESELYVQELEETMDNQLRVWQEEEETFRSEVKELRRQSNQGAKSELMLQEAQSQLKELQQQLFNASNEAKQLHTMKDQLEDRCKDAIAFERSARESSEKHKETIRDLQEEKQELQNTIQNLKIQLETQKELSMSIDVENEMEIKKLREQLKHAAFRVQIMRNESPKRRRQGNTEEVSEESTIAKLMQQLKSADAKAEAAWKAKREAEESLLSIQSADIVNNSGTDFTRDDIESLTQKLHDARARSRRIAVKSEEELSKLRESEAEMRIIASNYEQDASKLKQKLKKVQVQYSEESETRKRIESALRNEISILRREKASTASCSPLPNSLKTHSNRIGKELQHLVDITATLHKTMSLITKAKQRISKEILEKMMKGVEDLKAIVSRVEAAAEEDKFQIEDAFINYESAVVSYETQIEELTAKMKKVKDELTECQKQRSEGAKKAHQTEMDMLAKLNSLQRRLSQVEKEYDEFKNRVEWNESKVDESSPSKDPHRPEIVNNNNTKPPINSELVKKSLKMKLHHGASSDNVEMNLHEEDDSTMGGVSISQSITSFRSLERSVKESPISNSTTNATSNNGEPVDRDDSPITTDEEESTDDSIRSLSIGDDKSFQASEASGDDRRIQGGDSFELPEKGHGTFDGGNLNSNQEEVSNKNRDGESPETNTDQSTREGSGKGTNDHTNVSSSERKRTESIDQDEEKTTEESSSTAGSEGSTNTNEMNVTSVSAKSGILAFRDEDSVLESQSEGSCTVEEKTDTPVKSMEEVNANFKEQLEKSLSSAMEGDDSMTDSFNSNPHDYYSSDISYDDNDQESV